MKTYIVLTSLSFSLAGGCFTPNEDSDLADATSQASQTDGSSSNDGESGASTNTPATATTTNDTTSNPATTADPTTADPTTTAPTSNDSDTQGDTASDPDPFCGDGNIDPNEECDDGLENNGLDQSCLPDCNLNVCGDSNIGPDEFCDDGADDNILEVGACAPDCSTVVEEKVINFSARTEGGNFGPNPVGYADGQCEAGFRALFAVPGVRQATNDTPFAADSPIDWPLRPYTAYMRSNGTPIWLTDETPLLGVRDGVTQPLENSPLAGCTSEFCAVLNTTAITGLMQDWTNATSDICNGWTNTADDDDMRLGQAESVSEYLDDNTDVACSFGASGAVLGGTAFFYCIEQ